MREKRRIHLLRNSGFVENVVTVCDRDEQVSGCTATLKMHGFAHAHEFYGNYIGPTTITFLHNGAHRTSLGQGLVQVTIIVPEGEIGFTAQHPSVGTRYRLTANDDQDDCFE